MTKYDTLCNRCGQIISANTELKNINDDLRIVFCAKCQSAFDEWLKTGEEHNTRSAADEAIHKLCVKAQVLENLHDKLYYIEVPIPEGWVATVPEPRYYTIEQHRIIQMDRHGNKVFKGYRHEYVPTQACRYEGGIPVFNEDGEVIGWGKPITKELPRMQEAPETNKSGFTKDTREKLLKDFNRGYDNLLTMVDESKPITKEQALAATTRLIDALAARDQLVRDGFDLMQAAMQVRQSKQEEDRENPSLKKMVSGLTADSSINIEDTDNSKPDDTVKVDVHLNTDEQGNTKVTSVVESTTEQQVPEDIHTTAEEKELDDAFTTVKELQKVEDKTPEQAEAERSALDKLIPKIPPVATTEEEAKQSVDRFNDKAGKPKAVAKIKFNADGSVQGAKKPTSKVTYNADGSIKSSKTTPNIIAPVESPREPESDSDSTISKEEAIEGLKGIAKTVGLLRSDESSEPIDEFHKLCDEDTVGALKGLAESVGLLKPAATDELEATVPKSHETTEEEIQKMVTMRKDGKSYKAIANATGRNVITVTKYIKKYMEEEEAPTEALATPDVAIITDVVSEVLRNTIKRLLKTTKLTHTELASRYDLSVDTVKAIAKEMKG